MPTDNADDYAEVVARLQDQAAVRLRDAHGNSDFLREAIMFYLREGSRLGLGSSELTDFFCVSTPNVVEAAGYINAAGDAVVALFDELHAQSRRTGGVERG